MLKDYTFGRIVADGQAHTNDIKIIDGQVVPEWWRKSGHRVEAADVRDILSAKPDKLVIGTGHSGNMRLTREAEDRLNAEGIEVTAAPTAEAMETFNRLHEAGENVAGGFHLTC